MEEKHVDYFLRRIALTDVNKPFRTTNEEFNTASNTLREFVNDDKDCHENGIFITYLFGKEEKPLGIARMKPLLYNEFKDEVVKNKFFEVEEIEQYKGLRVIYMSRAGVSKEINGLGFGAMLRAFLDAHSRSMYNNFLLYALINELMYKSMLKRFGNEFFNLYKVSKKCYDEKWKWYWVILREFTRP